MNKIFLILTLPIFFACNDDDDVTSLQTEVLMYEEVSPGNKQSKPISFRHFIFEAEDKSLTVRDRNDLRGGFVYDQRSGMNYQAVQETLEIDGVFNQELKPGKYFIVVMISDIDDARFSSTTVNVYPNKQVYIKKIFDECCNGISEEW